MLIVTGVCSSRWSWRWTGIWLGVLPTVETIAAQVGSVGRPLPVASKPDEDQQRQPAT